MNKRVPFLLGLTGVLVYGLAKALQAKACRQRLAERMHRADNRIDLNSEDSFPASDPPSWTPIAGSRA